MKIEFEKLLNEINNTEQKTNQVLQSIKSKYNIEISTTTILKYLRQLVKDKKIVEIMRPTEHHGTISHYWVKSK